MTTPRYQPSHVSTTRYQPSHVTTPRYQPSSPAPRHFIPTVTTSGPRGYHYTTRHSYVNVQFGGSPSYRNTARPSSGSGTAVSSAEPRHSTPGPLLHLSSLSPLVIHPHTTPAPAPAIHRQTTPTPVFHHVSTAAPVIQHSSTQAPFIHSSSVPFAIHPQTSAAPVIQLHRTPAPDQHSSHSTLAPVTHFIHHSVNSGSDIEHLAHRTHSSLPAHLPPVVNPIHSAFHRGPPEQKIHVPLTSVHPIAHIAQAHIPSPVAPFHHSTPPPAHRVSTVSPVYHSTLSYSPLKIATLPSSSPAPPVVQSLPPPGLEAAPSSVHHSAPVQAPPSPALLHYGYSTRPPPSSIAIGDRNSIETVLQEFHKATALIIFVTVTNIFQPPVCFPFSLKYY